MKKMLKLLLYVVLIVIAVIVLIPIIYSFLGSFKTNQELLTSGSKLFPEKIVFDNYIQAWELADFKTYTWNSIVLSFFSVIGVVVTSSMTGYVYARGDFPGKKIIFGLFTATMFISLGTITLYPKVMVARFLHINKSLLGIIVMYVFGVNVTNIYLVKGFVSSLPREIDEAAEIDGCGFFRTFVTVLLPLMKPILATISILTFKIVWNDYLLPMIFTISDPSKAPLVVGVVALKNTGEAATSWNLMLAGTMISIIPMVVVYLILNRQFVEGIASGAVKG